MKALIEYKHYSYFDTSWEAKYMHKERMKYRDSLITEEDKKIKEKNEQELRDIFQWLKNLVITMDRRGI